jgi:hypothetical protein
MKSRRALIRSQIEFNRLGFRYPLEHEVGNRGDRRDGYRDRDPIPGFQPLGEATDS